MTAAADADPVLIAGASGSERRPPRREGGSPDWHQPEHIRDAAAARTRLEDAVIAGADVVLAPAYLTHRRALSPYGETRRAAEWTRGAVAVARQAVEQAQERAAASGSAPLEPTDAVAEVRGATSTALVAGPISPLRSGRFEGALDTGVIAEEDRARTDLLAEAGVDRLLIESMPSLVEARSAAQAAATTGVPFWLGLQLAPSGIHLPSGDTLDAVWQELAALAPAGLLVTPSSPDAAEDELETVLRLVDVPVGLWVDASGPDLAAAAGTWLSAGASLVGLASGATPERIRALRVKLDERMAATAERRATDQGAWFRTVEEAAHRAAGGRALWLGGDAPTALPDGFHWTVLEDRPPIRLPDGAYGLVVSVEGTDPLALTETARLLDDGGYLLLSSAGALESIPEGLAIQSIETAAGRHLTLLRRRA